MANTLYSKFKELALNILLLGGSTPGGATVKAALVDTSAYVFSQTHRYYSDISAGIVSVSEALSSKVVTNGVFDADDLTFTAVSGGSVEAVVLFIDTGNAATSPLIAYLDTGSGLPFTPSGADVTLRWNNGAEKIFTL